VIYSRKLSGEIGGHQRQSEKGIGGCLPLLFREDLLPISVGAMKIRAEPSGDWRRKICHELVCVTRSISGGGWAESDFNWPVIRFPGICLRTGLAKHVLMESVHSVTNAIPGEIDRTKHVPHIWHAMVTIKQRNFFDTVHPYFFSVSLIDTIHDPSKHKLNSQRQKRFCHRFKC
jgi:hypothetical protein